MLQATAGSDWGVASGDSWGGSQLDSNDNTFNFSDLEQALDTAQSNASRIPPQQAQPGTQIEHQQPDVASCTLDEKHAGPQLPGFYLHMTSEAAGASESMTAEDRHIAELVAAYQNENQKVQDLHD